MPPVRGSRLYPMTRPVCKPLLPVYDKPMIYYPLAALLQAGIRDILIIIPPGEEGPFYRLLGSGGRFGVNITYEVQGGRTRHRGRAAHRLPSSSGMTRFALFWAIISSIPPISRTIWTVLCSRNPAPAYSATMSMTRVRSALWSLMVRGRAISIEEKPRYPKSNYIIPGLYFYDNSVMEIARGLKPSARGELEITDVNIEYMKRGQLHVEKLDRDFVWLDAGTADNLLESAQVVRRVQDETGRYIACPEEIAYARGYISRQTLLRHAEELNKTLYGRYLECL